VARDRAAAATKAARLRIKAMAAVTPLQDALQELDVARHIGDQVRIAAAKEAVAKARASAEPPGHPPAS
jgi:hypothetical protein